MEKLFEENPIQCKILKPLKQITVNFIKNYVILQKLRWIIAHLNSIFSTIEYINK